MIVEFDAVLYEWQARRSDRWTFVNLPHDVSDEILDRVGDAVRGFGSVRVEVTVGDTRWRTSIFPDNRARTYSLPVKKAVRAAEGLATGDTAHFSLRLVDF